MNTRKIGLWLVGAYGGVATTTILGLIGLQKRRISNNGLVSCLPEFEKLSLMPWENLVVGGHEIRHTSLSAEAEQLAKVSRAVDMELVRDCQEAMQAIDQAVRPGTLYGCGRKIAQLADPSRSEDEDTPAEIVARLRRDMREFMEQRQLDTLVVVNVASTELPLDPGNLPKTWDALEPLLGKPDECPLPASCLYAIAAFQEGCVYVNFTPSPGATPPAIAQLAERHQTCHAGQDGKTGETLLKSVLAPMFAYRNLQVMSWVGHNIFGNLDGKVLDDPLHKQSKVASKDRVLHEVLGYAPQTLVGIEYVESLGDWKTAWDHIHFRGFLDTPMVMQFIWQGCDSILAAPLVLDLVRFSERAHRAGQHGALTFLASFFKSPIGVDEHRFERQFQMLEQWCERLSSA